MAFFSDLAQHLEVLRDAFGGDVEAEHLPALVERLGDESVVAALEAATGLVRAGEKVRIAAAGVAAARSTREAGHDGLAQKLGHRSPASLIQEITGATRAEAAKHVRLGEALRAAAVIEPDDDAVADAATAADTEGAGSTVVPLPEPWHAPLGRALLAGIIGSAQHDAILRGLGNPPAPADAAPDDADGDADGDADAVAEAREAWSVAAEHLIVEAQERTVEELGRTARTVRDQLDPEGAQRRFDDQFDERAFRLWRDADGVRRGSIVFDDLGGAWAQTILDSALRPRRGGPRFVDPDEKARADELIADPRSNDQLAYDLFLDVLRAGALADAATVFGTRQAGVRVLVTRAAADADASGEPAVALVEDDQTSIPAWLVRQQVCDTGTVPCTLDTTGSPLDVGREARLFTPRQRIALAARDGGCRWRGCDRPASYCEAHHIDEWVRDSGRTDIDRGVLLCRWHHTELHHGGWRITRQGRGDFVLHPPPGRGTPIVLAPRLALRYAWADLDPPPRRFRRVA
ncbi:DUF222 domain-containing protein [Microbacterium allomyrinae]|uniref:DUF222 domain-containing protein n=1 Tax=Microbacterium allomyrinae TaxID=2830666 RepID=A0A9X1LXR4_9MICO|nr:DUF222 domain-containing protein [Microbacterium allomyrinae]MCC2033721.1 DUF222 domain-containing protein [Microbacterium allomyrinae]